MKIQTTINRTGFSGFPVWRYLLCFWVCIIIHSNTMAQEVIEYMNEPIWSSKDNSTFSMQESLGILNIPQDAIDFLDELELTVAADVFEGNLFIRDKSLEVHSTSVEDELYLSYYFSSINQDENEPTSSILTVPIKKFPLHSNLKDILDAHDPSFVSTENEDPLKQNYPNPLITETTIEVETPDQFNSAQLVIADKYGFQLFTFDSLEPGTNLITLGRDQLSFGIYFYHLIIDNNLISTKRMIVE